MPLSMTCITHYVLVMPLTRARVRPRALVLTARWVVAGVARHGLGHCEDLLQARRRPEVDESVQARADHHVRARDGVGPPPDPGADSQPPSQAHRALVGPLPDPGAGPGDGVDFPVPQGRHDLLAVDALGLGAGEELQSRVGDGGAQGRVSQEVCIRTTSALRSTRGSGLGGRSCGLRIADGVPTWADDPGTYPPRPRTGCGCGGEFWDGHQGPVAVADGSSWAVRNQLETGTVP